MIIPSTFLRILMSTMLMMSLEKDVVIRDELTTELSIEQTNRTFFKINLEILN